MFVVTLSCVVVLDQGIEAAVHTIFDLVNKHNDDGWCVLLIDASNAFNSINRRPVIWNSHVLWPNCSLFLFNCYRGWAPLVITDSAELLYSKEGVTQGDPFDVYLRSCNNSHDQWYW